MHTQLFNDKRLIAIDNLSFLLCRVLAVTDGEKEKKGVGVEGREREWEGWGSEIEREKDEGGREREI
jgi:hypothetical protein